VYNRCVWKSVVISVSLEQFRCQIHFTHSSPTKAAPSADSVGPSASFNNQHFISPIIFLVNFLSVSKQTQIIFLTKVKHLYGRHQAVFTSKQTAFVQHNKTQNCSINCVALPYMCAACPQTVLRHHTTRHNRDLLCLL
jgi:hypothetical protein